MRTIKLDIDCGSITCDDCLLKEHTSSDTFCLAFPSEYLNITPIKNDKRCEQCLHVERTRNELSCIVKIDEPGHYRINMGMFEGGAIKL